MERSMFSFFLMRYLEIRRLVSTWFVPFCLVFLKCFWKCSKFSNDGNQFIAQHICMHASKDWYPSPTSTSLLLLSAGHCISSRIFAWQTSHSFQSIWFVDFSAQLLSTFTILILFDIVGPLITLILCFKKYTYAKL